MRELGIDIETYSSNDLPDCGVYKYVEAEDFTILLFAYSWDGAPAVCVDLASGEELPAEVYDALTDPSIVKTAFNASFERICIQKHFGLRLDVRQWKCTMVRAARMGLPLSLGQCAEVLHIEEGKMAEGRALIRLFSQPSRSGKRVMPSEKPDKWDVFKLYNARDVDVEQAVLAKVRRLEPAEFDERLYIADQNINDRGVLIDQTLARNAERFDDTYKAELLEEAKALTGLENPNSPSQLKDWILKVTGLRVDSLNKKSMEEIEALLSHFRKPRQMIALRKELGKTSCKKYGAMLSCVCADGRIHGLLQFCGAARTGRWAGRLVQVQNLPQNHLASLDDARRLVLDGDYEEFAMSYASVSSTLSELIRTAFIASPGHTFHVCDFSAIEARVISWYAGEKWVLEVFRTHGKIYEATAAQMYHVPIETITKMDPRRQKGKIATLALGYGGGISALEAMGGKRIGLSEDEMREIVKMWRRSNPNIVRFWETVEKAAMRVIKDKMETPVRINRGLELSYRWGMLLVKLPSGRTICYPRAKVSVEFFGKEDKWVDIAHHYNDGFPHWGLAKNYPLDAIEAGIAKWSIEYEGVNQTTKKWDVIRTYGGKLVENIVQATARDILGEVILKAEDRGFPIVFHIHDEIIVEAGPEKTLDQVEALFSEEIPWCKDLPLKGAGYSTPYYLKD